MRIIMPSTDDAIEEAHRMHSEASASGFDWPDVSGVLEKAREEIQELEDALAHGDLPHARRELGDLLFTAVNVARFLKSNPSDELRRATDRFRKRFLALKEELCRQGRRMEDCTLDELDVVWEEVKKSIGEDAKTS